VVALVAVCAALAGNLLLNPSYVRVFAVYFLVAVAVVGVMFLRVQILELALAALRGVIQRLERINRRLNIGIIRRIRRINSLQVVYFSKGDNLAALNRAALYVMQNELTNRLKVVHCYEREEEISQELAEHLKTIDRIYPRIRIDLVLLRGRFGPELIEKLSRRLGVPKNYMFIGTPGDRFPHNIAELGGVRLIM